MPVQVLGITDATAITMGGAHSCALHQDGTISCWGSNYYGELGNGTTRDSSVPVKVTGITDATAITTGIAHTCALRGDSTISCWGSNYRGQLGDGNGGEIDGNDRIDIFSSAPVQVTGITDATAITTGGWHTCALHQDGTISCWGENYRGELGDGNGGEIDGNDWIEAFSSVPVQVTGITDATAITIGGGHTCALHQDGTISCWGNNSGGELGNGQSTGDSEDKSADSSIPVRVIGITDAIAITTGGAHSCALHQNGAISCWGGNGLGQLGNGQVYEDSGQINEFYFRSYTTTFWPYRETVPVGVADITDATAITAGDVHTCALHQDGTISCWGDNDWGQLGDGNNGWNDGNQRIRIFSSVPVRIVGFGG